MSRDFISGTDAVLRPRPIVAFLVVALVLTTSVAWAESGPGDSDTPAIEGTPIARVGTPSMRPRNLRDPDKSGSTGWWFGPTGVALILAVCGGICMAARKILPPSSSPGLQVVGRVSLSAKHSVYLLRVEDRVLLIGAGPQGAPSYLGELPDTRIGNADTSISLASIEKSPTPRTPVPASDSRAFRNGHGSSGSRLDVRLGDEE